MVIEPVVSARFRESQRLTACATSRMTQSVIECVTTRSGGTISFVAMGVSQFHQR